MTEFSTNFYTVCEINKLHEIAHRTIPIRFRIDLEKWDCPQVSTKHCLFLNNISCTF